jgi:hypothetical protein
VSGEAALAARIRAEVSDLGEVVDRAERLLAKARATGDEDYLDGVALKLHGFYSGVERVFESIARDLDGSVPTGPGWHRDLLVQMTAPVAGVRPAVIGVGARQCLDEYRGFHHVVRNVYTTHLRPLRVRELADGLRDCYTTLARDAGALCDFLERLGQP